MDKKAFNEISDQIDQIKKTYGSLKDIKVDIKADTKASSKNGKVISPKKRLNHISLKEIKTISKIEELELDKLDIERTEHAICIVSVSAVGEVSVISMVNEDEASCFYVEEGKEYIEEDFNEPPGIYLIDFWVNGCKDYWGEYDSWSEYDHIVKYKIDIADKRKDKFSEGFWEKDFCSKVYNDCGSEYPRALLITNEHGVVEILDILNEEKAYKSIIQEAVYSLHRIDTIDELECMSIYEADLSIQGDMVNLLDRDMDETLVLSNVKKIHIELDNEALKKEEGKVFLQYAKKCKTLKS